MRPEARQSLARTLAVLAEQGPSQLSIEALWIGEGSQKEVAVNADRLVELAADDKVKARKPGAGKLKALTAAPGDYVRVRH